MVAPLLLLLLGPWPNLQVPDTPGHIVARAEQVAGTGAEAEVRAAWARQLEAHPQDRAARLGLATLARLGFAWAEAESLYAAILGLDPTDPLGGYALLGRGESAMVRARLQEAEAWYRRAESVGRATGDSALRVWALLGIAATVVRTQRDAASDSLLLLAAGLAPPADIRLRAALRCARAGPPLQPGELSEKAEAQAGARLARAAGDRRQYGRCLLGVAKAHYRLGERDSALGRSGEATRVLAQIGDRADLANTLQWQGYARLTGGDYGGAWTDLQQALAEADRNGSPGPAAQASVYLASLALRFGDPALALDHAARAESLLVAQGNDRLLTALLGVRGDIARAAGDTGRARQLYETVIDRSSRFGGFPAVSPHRGLAALARQQGDWPAAERELQLARSLALGQGMQLWERRVRYDAGALALARGDLAGAEREFHRFLADLGPEAQSRGYGARLRLAQIAALRGDVAGAELALQQAADSLDAVRARLTVPDLRLEVFQVRDDDADPGLGLATTLNALAQAGRVASAFQLFERRRGRELREQLLRARALSQGRGLSPEAVPAPLDLPGLQRALAERRVALLAFLTGEGSEPVTAFRITAEGIRAQTLAPIARLRPDIVRFTDLLESGAAAPAPARQLGEALLDPVLTGLDSAVTTLVIVADAGLERLPFGALVLADGTRLAQRFGLASVPSAAVLLHQWDGEPKPAGRRVAVLALGDPRVPAAEPAGVTGHQLDRLARQLPRLEASAGEARAAAARGRPGRLRLGNAASEGWLRQADLTPFGVVHFASHALVSEAALTRTALVLAPGEGQDGLLTPGEIADLRLDADLVVLSACATAGGVSVAGEGVQGLAAPLLAAGARAVLATHWKVPDRETAAFVAQVYRELSRGRPLGGALQQAQRTAIARGEPPRVWAAFTIVGDPLPVIPVAAPSAGWRWPAALAMVLVVAGAAWRRRRALRAAG